MSKVFGICNSRTWCAYYCIAKIDCQMKIEETMYVAVFLIIEMKY